MGAYNLKEPKSSFLDDAAYYSSMSPSHKYNIKYDLTRSRTIATRLVPSKDKPSAGRLQIRIENVPAPGHYKVEESFRSSQLAEKTFVISKTKSIGLADHMTNEKKFVPAVGSYNTEQAYDKVTKGLAKGWK